MDRPVKPHAFGDAFLELQEFLVSFFEAKTHHKLANHVVDMTIEQLGRILCGAIQTSYISL